MFSFTKPTETKDSKLFTVLVADGIRERTDNFRIKGAGYQLKIVNNLPEMFKALDEPPFDSGKWDVVFLSGFLGAWSENVKEIAATFTRQHKAKKLRSVVLTGLIDDEMKKMTLALKAEGVPAAWYPYNYTNPSLHERKEVK